MFDRQPYLRNSYAIFCGSDSYFYRVVNHLMPNGKKIALIKDSYANIMVPFLALQSREMPVPASTTDNNRAAATAAKRKTEILMMKKALFLISH